MSGGSKMKNTRKIRDSLPDMRWIRNIYNDTILDQVQDLPALCSGTTLGGQPAMRTYSRAMVHQFDITQSKGFVGDQGHHNYLVHMDKLVGAPNISKIKIQISGEGFVNTVGLELIRLRVPLHRWRRFNNQTESIINDDGTESHVVHNMFDRRQDLNEIIQKQIRQELMKWNATEAQEMK